MAGRLHETGQFFKAIDRTKGNTMTDRQKTTESQESENLVLELRSRTRDEKSGEFQESHRTVRWNPRQTAIIICDMWNDHTCKSAAERVAEMAPSMNRMVSAARDTGVFVIHAPSGTLEFYEKTPQRLHAMEAPFVEASVEIKWNHWNPEREGEPLPLIRHGGCGCSKPCPGWVADDQGIHQWKGDGVPWTRQIKTIEIHSEDAISDSGQEIYNLMHNRGIDNVILMGVHTNICVSGRPFGIRQMVYFGKNVVLCRDLTDSLFQTTSQGFSHFRGTDVIVEHIEKHWCPTITSTAFTKEPAFRFREDTA
jgi:nicotinamidase-related amidase